MSFYSDLNCAYKYIATLPAISENSLRINLELLSHIDELFVDMEGNSSTSFQKFMRCALEFIVEHKSEKYYIPAIDSLISALNNRIAGNWL